MRRFYLLLLLCLPLALMAQNTHLKVTQSGAFGTLNLSTFDPTNGSSVTTLSVSRSSGSGTTLTYTNVSESADFNTLTITNLFGTIPDADFSGQNTQNLALNVDTTTLDPSAIFSETCVLVINPFSFTCGAGPAGVISVQWRENDAQSTQILTLEEVINTGNVTTRIHQKSDNSTADVSGTVFGVDVSTATGTVGTNKNSSLEVIRWQ